MSIQVKKPLVTIIVLNWNGKRFIDDFFASIARQTYPVDRVEVLFVDNHSSDDSVAYFLNKALPNTRLIQTGDNYGYAGGNNFGFREAKGDYIVVCNNDLELEEHWLEKLIQTAEKTHADIVVPKLVFADSHLINNAGSQIFPDRDWPIIERGVDQPENTPEFNQQVAVTAFCGASPLFKRSFLHDVGLFDKRFFLYWEDGDLSWRGQKVGKKYIYSPKAIAYHHHSGSTGGEQSPVFIHYVSRNRVLILIKHARLRVAAKAFAKVGRDHVLYKIRDCYHTFRNHSGRKASLLRLWRGIKIIGDIMRLTPLMLAKRWGIITEEHL